jgi:hypothetical protein
MSNKFDEMAKGLAQSVTRRGALKKFGIGFASAALAWIVLANKAGTGHGHGRCNCKKAYYGCDPTDIACLQNCAGACSP